MTRHAPVDSSLFAGYRFPTDLILLAVRWYLRYGLSYRDVEELLAERGVEVDHVTIHRWVQRFTPLLIYTAQPCRHAVGDRWFVDETYIKVAGVWRYIDRAVDQPGQVIDIYVSKRRDTTAASRFFTSGSPVTAGLRRSPPTSLRPCCALSMSCWLTRTMTRVSTPTIASSVTMGVSRRDFAQCAACGPTGLRWW